MNISWRVGNKPEQSGNYLVLYKNKAGCYHFAEIEYSAKYQIWNYSDMQEAPEPDVVKTKDILWGDIRFWAPANEIISALKAVIAD